MAMREQKSVDALVRAWSADKIRTTRARKVPRKSFERYVQLKSLMKRCVFLGTGQQDHPFFQELSEKQRFHLALAAEGLGDLEAAVLVQHNIRDNPKVESFGAVFLEWLQDRESVEVLADRASPEMFGYLVSSVVAKTKESPLPLFLRWHAHETSLGNHFLAARVAYKAQQFDWLAESVRSFRFFEWPEFKKSYQIIMEFMGPESHYPLAEQALSWGQKPHQAAKEIVSWARTAKARGMDNYPEIYWVARKILQDCKLDGYEGRVCAEMRKFEEAFALLDRAKHWYSASLFSKKVNRHPATIARVQKSAVEKYYLQELINVPGRDRTNHVLKSEDAANRLHREKFFFKLLMDDYRWEEARRYANLHALPAQYSDACLAVKARVAQLCKDKKWLDEVASMSVVEVKPVVCFGTDPVQLEERDLAAILMLEIFGQSQDLCANREQRIACLAAIAKTRPRFACYHAAEQQLADLVPYSWIVRARRKYAKRGVATTKLITMASVYAGACERMAQRFRYVPRPKRATEDLPCIYGLRPAPFPDGDLF